MFWYAEAVLEGIRRLVLPLAAGLLLVASLAAHAATITVTTRSVPGLSPPAQTFLNTVRITGVIERGDASRVRRILVELKRKTIRIGDVPVATAELSSIGGDVEEGIKIGYLFREFDVPTVVRKSDFCLSACALAFLGGRHARTAAAPAPDRSIDIGGEVGFHNFALNPWTLQSMSAGDQATRLKESFELGRGGTSMIVRYASDLGIEADFLLDVLSRSPDRIDYVDSTENFVALQICPTSAIKPAISAERQAANICGHASGWPDSAIAPRVTPLTTRQARLRLLGYVRHNGRTPAAGDRLGAQIDAVMRSKDERLISSTYASLKAGGIPLPELWGITYEVGQNPPAGAYQMSCVVSFSAEDPDRYDVVVQGPEGLARASHKAPPSCRWLFRHDRQAVLNPPRQ